MDIDISQAIDAITRFVATASATELAAVFAFPLAFLAVMVILFRRAHSGIRAVVFLVVFAVAGALLGLVVYVKLFSDDVNYQLSRAIERGCIPFENDRYTIADTDLPFSLQERLASSVSLFLERSGLGPDADLESERKPQRIMIIAGIENNQTRAYAIDLGERRANAAARWLENRFEVDPGAMTLMSIGMEEGGTLTFPRVGKWMCAVRLFTENEFEEIEKGWRPGDPRLP